MDTRNMKKVRGNPTKEPSPTTAKKKGKGAAEKAEEVAAQVVEEMQEGGDGVVAVEEKAEWGGGMWSGVDEEMSWATCWFPFWEMEAVGDAYEALYGDVWLDYDIWGLKASANASNP